MNNQWDMTDQMRNDTIQLNNVEINDSIDQQIDEGIVYGNVCIVHLNSSFTFKSSAESTINRRITSRIYGFIRTDQA